MRILVFSLLLIFSGTVLVNAQDLSFATFNCFFLNKNKVHIKYGLPYSLKNASKGDQKFWDKEENVETKFKEATKKVAAQIKKINADIIGLTEVGKKEEVEILIDELNKLGMDYKYWEVGDSKDFSTGQHVAILSKYELKNVVYSFENRGLYFTESDFDETSETGISKGMMASVEYEGEEIHIFLAHFKSESGGEESDQQRIKQAEIIRRLTIPLSLQNKNVVVMGDFNNAKRHEVLMNLRGFNDVFEELIQTGDSKYFKDDNAHRWTYEYKGERAQIDHILISLPLSKKCYSNTKTRMGIETEIFLTEDPVVSDHNAIKASLYFKD